MQLRIAGGRLTALCKWKINCAIKIMQILNITERESRQLDSFFFLPFRFFFGISIRARTRNCGAHTTLFRVVSVSLIYKFDTRDRNNPRFNSICPFRYSVRWYINSERITRRRIFIFRDRTRTWLAFFSLSLFLFSRYLRIYLSPYNLVTRITNELPRIP